MTIMSVLGPTGKEVVLKGTAKGELLTAALKELADAKDPTSMILLMQLREMTALRLGMIAAGTCKPVSGHDIDSELKKTLIVGE